MNQMVIENKPLQLDVFASDLLTAELRDCFNCIHNTQSSCKAPKYLNMDAKQASAFWKITPENSDETICGLFEVNAESEFLTFSPSSPQGKLIEDARRERRLINMFEKKS